MGPVGGRGLVVTTVALALGTAGTSLVWAQADPASFARRVSMPALGVWRWHTIYRGRWRTAMGGVGLLRVWDGVEHAPQVDRSAPPGTGT